MIDLVRHPRLLRTLTFLDRVKAFVRRRDMGKSRAESHLAAFYEKAWREAAARIGASVTPLGHGVLEIRLGDFQTRVISNTTSLDDLVAHCFVRTKPVVFQLLAEHGLPIPRHLEFNLAGLDRAAAFLKERGGDCVLKPASGTGGGLGVTTGIRTPWQLARAAGLTAAHGGDLLLEEQIAGDNYRLLYLDGQLLDVVLRHPPTVIGDGQSSVYRLVLAANADRVRRGAEAAHVLLTLDMDMRRTLAGQGLSLSSVPAPGAMVTVKAAINENGAADNVAANHLLCDSIIADGVRAARAVGVRLAGVDVITRDPTVPLSESGGVILEVNSPPGYYWHYRKRDGSFPVAVHVLECLLNSHRHSGVCVS